MVLFGELVEPTSRALWDFDENDYATSSKFEPKLEEYEPLTNDIATLLIVETEPLVELVKQCLKCDKLKVVAEIKDAHVKIHRYGKVYIVLYESKKNEFLGTVTETLEPYIKSSKLILALTSQPSALYQTSESFERPVCFIRGLHSEEESQLKSRILESPNLVTGFGASVLSYGIYKGIPTSLYVCYLDSLGLDSKSAQPITYLLARHNVAVRQNYVPVKRTVSNLYM